MSETITIWWKNAALKLCIRKKIEALHEITDFVHEMLSVCAPLQCFILLVYMWLTIFCSDFFLLGVNVRLRDGKIDLTINLFFLNNICFYCTYSSTDLYSKINSMAFFTNKVFRLPQNINNSKIISQQMWKMVATKVNVSPDES